MDGSKRQLKDSIQLRLSFWLSSAILVVAVVAGIFAFIAAFDEVHELQDEELRQVATLFDRHRLAPLAPGADDPLQEKDNDSRITVQYLAERAVASAGRARQSGLSLPATLTDGLHTLEIMGQPLRVYVRTLATGERLAVAQETEARDEIARNSALRTVMPFLVLMPILLLVVASLVRKMFQPISSLAVEIDLRGEEELHPVATERLPTEIRPFIIAINRLFHRVALSMEAKRRFIADAAHELRSPLTALSLQAERLADAPLSDGARERLDVMRQGIERGRRLLDQLLTLARAQSDSAQTRTLVSVQETYRSLLEDLLPLAEAKKIDLGVEGEDDVRLWLDEIDLKTLIKNLLDNAIRYTPEGGRVDLSVSCSENRAILQVVDSGPGIAPGELERVFDPFYRVLGSDEIGSGLGLSIVRTIADRLGAQVRLGYADESSQAGLCARVIVPISPISRQG